MHKEIDYAWMSSDGGVMDRKVYIAATTSLLCLLTPVASAVCLVKTVDLDKVVTTAQIIKNGNLSFIDPCIGEVKADIKVMVYQTRDTAQRHVLHQGDNLKRIAPPKAAGLKDPGSFYVATSMLSSQLQERSGAQRFDPISGLILGGPVLMDAPLLIPLGAYAWSETEKVTLSYGKRSQVLSPRNGFITVDLKAAKVQAFTLVQGSRRAIFEVLGDSLDPELAERYGVLQKARHEEDGEFARSQLATLFWEWGLSNNAMSVTYEAH